MGKTDVPMGIESTCFDCVSLKMPLGGAKRVDNEPTNGNAVGPIVEGIITP
jgi:hypothetical protein